MDLATTTALIIFLAPLAYSPGPGNQFFAALAAQSGLPGTVPALAGYHLATWLVTFAIGTGAGAVLLARPPVLSAMAVLGGGYMIWLGVKGWRAAGSSLNPNKSSNADGTAGFLAGALLLILNGKAYIIIALMFAAFSAEHSLSTVAWITTIFTVNNLIAFVAWAAFGAAVARWARAVGAATTVDRVFALAIVVVGAWLIVRTLTG